MNELKFTEWVIEKLKAGNHARVAERLGATDVEDVKSFTMEIVHKALRMKLAEGSTFQRKMFGSLRYQVETGSHHLTEKHAIYLDGPPKVGASLVTTPEFDFRSRRIAELKYVGFSPVLVVTVVPQVGRSAVTISYHRKDKGVLGVLPAQIREMPDAERRRVLSWFLVIHGENVAYAPPLVDALPAEMRRRIEATFHETLYSAISYDGLPQLDLF